MSTGSAVQQSGRSLILGLGNPGARYRLSRHNLGFRTVEVLAERRGIRIQRLECNSLLGGDDRVLLALPQTYMNRSGYAARCLVERHGFESTSILVVFDEVQLPLGSLRLRPRGGPGGHRGMESVIQNLRTEGVPRLRLGIGDEDCPPDPEGLVEYVLSPFPAHQHPAVEEMVVRAAEACQVWLEEGVEAAMNRFNP